MKWVVVKKDRLEEGHSGRLYTEQRVAEGKSTAVHSGSRGCGWVGGWEVRGEGERREGWCDVMGNAIRLCTSYIFYLVIVGYSGV